MTDLLLDQDTGDLCILNGELCVITTEEELTRQAIIITLNTLKGEWFRNIDYGTPWIENENNRIALLGKTSRSFVDSQIRLAIKSLPEVVSISEYSSTFNQITGEMSISVGVISKNGNLVLVNMSFTGI